MATLDDKIRQAKLARAKAARMKLQGSVSNIPAEGELMEQLSEKSSIPGFYNDLNDIRFLVNFLSKSSVLDLVEVTGLDVGDTQGEKTTEDALIAANKVLRDTMGLTQGQIIRDGKGGKFLLRHPVKQKDGSVKNIDIDFSEIKQDNPLEGFASKLIATLGDSVEVVPPLAGILSAVALPSVGVPAMVTTTTAAEAGIESARRAVFEDITGQKSAQNINPVVQGLMQSVGEPFVIGKTLAMTGKVASTVGSFVNNCIQLLRQIPGAEEALMNGTKVAAKLKSSLDPVTKPLGQAFDMLLNRAEEALSTESKTMQAMFDLNNKVYSNAAKASDPKEISKILKRDAKEVVKYFKRIRGNADQKNAFQLQTLEYLQEYADGVYKSVSQRMPTGFGKALAKIDAKAKSMVDGAMDKLNNLIKVQPDAVGDPTAARNLIEETLDDVNTKLSQAPSDLSKVTDDFLATGQDTIKLGSTIQESINGYVKQANDGFITGYKDVLAQAKKNPQLLDPATADKIKGFIKQYREAVESSVKTLGTPNADAIQNELLTVLSPFEKGGSEILEGIPTRATPLTDYDVLEFLSKMGQVQFERGGFGPGNIAQDLTGFTNKISRSLKGLRGGIVDTIKNIDSEVMPPTLSSRLKLMDDQRNFYDVFDFDTQAKFTASPKEAYDAYGKILLSDPQKATSLLTQAGLDEATQKSVNRKIITQDVDSPAALKKKVGLEAGDDLANSEILNQTGLTDEIVNYEKQIQSGLTDTEALKVVKGKLEEGAKQAAETAKFEREFQLERNQLIDDLQNNRIPQEQFDKRMGELGKKAGAISTESTALYNTPTAPGATPLVEQGAGVIDDTAVARVMKDEAGGRSGLLRFLQANDLMEDSMRRGSALDPVTFSQTPAAQESRKASQLGREIIFDKGSAGEAERNALSSALGGLTFAATGNPAGGNLARISAKTLGDFAVNSPIPSQMAYGAGELLNTGGIARTLGSRLGNPAASIATPAANMGGQLSQFLQQTPYRDDPKKSFSLSNMYSKPSALDQSKLSGSL